MSEHNPDLQPPVQLPPNGAIQPGAPDFVETPDMTPGLGEHEPLPVWLYIVCGLALFLAGSSFTGFSTFGLGLMDQGPGGPSISTSTQVAAPETPMSAGKKVYGQNCAACHQASGEGTAGTYPPLVKSEWVIGNKDRLAAILFHGLQGPISVNGASYGSSVMPAWGTVLSNEKLADVMTYMRASWGNTANAVSEDEVAKARSRFASHSGPWSEADLIKIAPNGPDPSDKK
jgi:mono/diheme cytochrome c family protein